MACIYIQYTSVWQGECLAPGAGSPRAYNSRLALPSVMAQPYESDITRMIRELLRDKPHIVQDQKKGRALWWDKKPDLEHLKRARESDIKQQAYVYQNKV